MPVPQEFVDSVSGSNIKTIAETPAVLTNVLLSNSIAFANAQSQLLQSITAKAAELLLTTDVSEGVGLAGLAQILTKSAQTTPPATAGV